MKKLIILIVALLVMTGCTVKQEESTQDQAKTLYIKAMENFKPTNFDLQIDGKEGDSASQSVVKMRSNGKFSETTAMMSVAFGEEKMQYYFVEEYMYLDFLGMKMKIKADQNEFNETFDIEENILSELNLEDIDFELMTFTEKGNLVTYSIDSESMEDISEQFENGKGSVTYVINKKDQTIVSMEIEMTGEDGEYYKIVANYEATDKIEMPDFSEYEEIAD